ncbi:hypothetical protein [Isoptericola hypogeus]
MWWWVWVLLVLAALAGVAALGLMLWRSGVRVLRAAGRASETFGAAGARAAEAADASVPPDTSPTIFDDPADLAERVADLRRRAAARRAVRRERAARTWQAWASGPSSTEAWLERRRAAKGTRPTPRRRPPSTSASPGGGGDHTRLP